MKFKIGDANKWLLSKGYTPHQFCNVLIYERFGTLRAPVFSVNDSGEWILSFDDRSIARDSLEEVLNIFFGDEVERLRKDIAKQTVRLNEMLNCAAVFEESSTSIH